MGYDMYWVEKADLELMARYEEISTQWEAALKVRETIPRQEQGQYTKEELDAGVLWQGAGVAANASDRYRAAQEHQHELYEQMCAAQVWYHRRNMAGMSLLCRVMERLDMVRSNYSTDECPFPWPERAWSDEDEDDRYYEWATGEWSKDQEAEFEAQRPDLMKAWREYKQAKDQRLTWVPEECFKVFVSEDEEVVDETPHAIPAHKFGTNDGWIVTPTECSAVLAKARKVSDEDLQLVFRACDVIWNPPDVTRSWQSWLAFIEGAASHGGFEVH